VRTSLEVVLGIAPGEAAAAAAPGAEGRQTVMVRQSIPAMRSVYQAGNLLHEDRVLRRLRGGSVRSPIVN